MKNKNSGTTIIETVIAIGIMSLLVLAATSFIRSLASQDRRNTAITETEWQATFVMDIISQSARNSTSITSPAVGVTASSTTLALAGVSAENPTQFTLSNGRIMVSKAGSTAVPITSDSVTVTSLTFQNVTATTTKGAIRANFNMQYKNPLGSPESNYATTRQITITIR